MLGCFCVTSGFNTLIVNMIREWNCMRCGEKNFLLVDARFESSNHRMRSKGRGSCGLCGQSSRRNRFGGGRRGFHWRTRTTSINRCRGVVVNWRGRLQDWLNLRIRCMWNNRGTCISRNMGE